MCCLLLCLLCSCGMSCLVIMWLWCVVLRVGSSCPVVVCMCVYCCVEMWCDLFVLCSGVTCCVIGVFVLFSFVLFSVCATRVAVYCCCVLFMLCVFWCIVVR